RADVGQLELDLGDLAAAARDAGDQRGAGDHRHRRPRVERQDAGRALEGPGRHHAPSRVWPQTLTVLPLTPVGPGLADQAIGSATSTGRPPCERLLSRRPASRGPNGIAAVIFVSMKPGATALIVASRPASSGAIDSTIPITPAFEVA